MGRFLNTYQKINNWFKAITFFYLKRIKDLNNVELIKTMQVSTLNLKKPGLKLYRALWVIKLVKP